MKKFVVVLCLLLPISYCLGQEQGSRLYTPTTLEWELMHAQSFHGGYFTGEMIVNVYPFEGNIVVDLRYSPTTIQHRLAQRHLDNIVLRIRQRLVDKGILVIGRIHTY